MNRPVVILALAVVGCAAASAHFWKQAHHERNRADQLQARVAELERYRSQPPNPFTSVAGSATATTEEATLKIPPQAVTAIQPSAAAQPRIATGIRDFRERFRRQQHLLLEDPEYREAMRVQQRMMLGQAYPDLTEALAIPPDQMDRFLDLLAEQQLQAQTDSAFEPTADPAQAAEQWQRKLQERERSNRAEIAELLGADGLQRWTDYQASLGARYRVRQLSNAMESAGAPLRQDQMKSLQQALAEGDVRVRRQWQASAGRFQANGRPPSLANQIEMQEEQLQRTAQSNEQLRTALSAILSGEQLEALKQIQNREQQMQQAQLRIQRAQLQAQERSGLSGEATDTIFSAGPGISIVAPDRR